MIAGTDRLREVVVGIYQGHVGTSTLISSF